MTSRPRKCCPRKKTCSLCWPSAAGLQSRVSGSLIRIKTLSQRTFASRHAGSLVSYKDRESCKDCLHENNVIPTREEQTAVRQQLVELKHSNQLLNTDQTAAFMVVARKADVGTNGDWLLRSWPGSDFRYPRCWFMYIIALIGEIAIQDCIFCAF